MLADGSIPMLPVSMDASSDNMSPNMLFVTIVSNCKLCLKILTDGKYHVASCALWAQIPKFHEEKKIPVLGFE